MPKCRSCGAEIKFIKMKSGRFNPCDLPKRSIIEGDGDVTLITERGTVVRGTYASVEDGANREGYTSHFATCPNAKQYRKGTS